MTPERAPTLTSHRYASPSLKTTLTPCPTNSTVATNPNRPRQPLEPRHHRDNTTPSPTNPPAVYSQTVYDNRLPRPLLEFVPRIDRASSQTQPVAVKFRTGASLTPTSESDPTGGGQIPTRGGWPACEFGLPVHGYMRFGLSTRCGVTDLDSDPASQRGVSHPMNPSELKFVSKSDVSHTVSSIDNYYYISLILVVACHILC